MGDYPSMKSIVDATRVRPGASPHPNDLPTHGEFLFPGKTHARDCLESDAIAINELQDTLYGEGKRALLVVLQGMDTAGKSGVIKGAFARTSPMGMRVAAFKAPTKQELAQDYLWRVHQVVPPKGFIGVFDRSHYEDVLVVKVREFASKDAIKQRYEQINQFEKHLTENGVVILKLMLHLSYDTQGERLLDRLEKPHKRWKFNPGDLEDRKLWPDFMDAYSDMLSKCSTKHAPWHVVPADSKVRRNAIAARLIRNTLEEMAPTYPDPGYRPDQFTIG